MVHNDFNRGGLPAAHARLAFDGHGYPGNPTVPPAQPLTEPGNAQEAIAPFGSYTEGQPIHTEGTAP